MAYQFFNNKSDAVKLHKVLKKAGYEVGEIEGKKASGYGVYRTDKSFWFDTDAPGGAIEVAAAFLGQGRYEYKKADAAEFDWLSRQYPEDYVRVSRVMRRDPITNPRKQVKVAKGENVRRLRSKWEVERRNPSIKRGRYGQEKISGKADWYIISKRTGEELAGPYETKQQAKDERLNEYGRVIIERRPHNNPSESAEDLSEKWHGRPPKVVDLVEEIETYETDGAVLADLEELGVITQNFKTRYRIEFKSDRPELVANVATEKLEIVGGDQELEVRGRGEVVIGFVFSIAYETDKHHLEGSNGKPESYEHFFGEEFYKSKGFNVADYDDSMDFFNDLLEEGIVEEAAGEGYLPTMIYDTDNCRIKLAGGRYKVEDVGLRD